MKFPKEFKHMKHKKGIMVYVHINGSVKCPGKLPWSRAWQPTPVF